MRKNILFLFCLIITKNISAQKLEGLWYSSDSTRIYEVKKSSKNQYSAFIKSSTRQSDKAGFIVLRDIEYNVRKKRFEGAIFSATDGDSTMVKIKFANPDKLSLKLSRMFVFDVFINWVRAE